LLPRGCLLTVRCGPLGRRSCRQPERLFLSGPDGAYSRGGLVRYGIPAVYSPVHSLVNQILNQPDTGLTAIHRPSDIVGGVPADDLPASRHTGVHFEGPEYIAPKPDCDDDEEQSHDQPSVMGAMFGHFRFLSVVAEQFLKVKVYDKMHKKYSLPRCQINQINRYQIRTVNINAKLFFRYLFRPQVCIGCYILISRISDLSNGALH